MKIGVFGHYNRGNLGDDASAEAVIQNLKTICTNVEIVCFNCNPDYASRAYKLAAYPIRRGYQIIYHQIPQNMKKGKIFSKQKTTKRIKIKDFVKKVTPLYFILKSIRLIIKSLQAVVDETIFLVQSFSRLRDIDAILVAGSGTLQERWGGPWQYPYTLFKWALLAKINGTKFIFMNSGAIPLSTRAGKFFIRTSLRLADYASYRDNETREICYKLGITKYSEVLADIAFSHPQLRGIKTVFRDLTPEKKLIIGLNPMPIYGTEFTSDEGSKVYENYIDSMAGLCQHIIDSSYDFIFFTTGPSDAKVINDIRGKIKTNNENDISSNAKVFVSNSVRQAIEVISKTDIIIASRYHGVIFSLAQYKPTICIARDDICRDKRQEELIKNVEQLEYLIMLNDLTMPDLINRTNDLIKNSEVVSKRLRIKNLCFSEQLALQYQRVLRLIYENKKKTKS